MTSGRSEGKSGRLPKIVPNFNVSFPVTSCSPTFHKNEQWSYKDAINEFGIKYWTSNPVWVTFQDHFMWILKKKYDYRWKKYGLEEKTDTATKTSLFDRNWVTSLKPRRRSRPLRLVWWALGVPLWPHYWIFFKTKKQLELSILYWKAFWIKMKTWYGKVLLSNYLQKCRCISQSEGFVWSCFGLSQYFCWLRKRVLVKTNHRNLLKVNHVNQLAMISIESSPLSEYKFKEAFNVWISKKHESL